MYSTEPPHDYDAPNPGTRILGFELRLPPGVPRTLAIDFLPGNQPAAVTPLSQW